MNENLHNHGEASILIRQHLFGWLRQNASSVFLLMAAAVVLLHPVESRAEAQGEPSVRFLNAEVTAPAGEQYVVFKSSLEITGPPQRWYTLNFQLHFNNLMPLLRSDKISWQQPWGQLFTPENTPTARYSDCRLGVTYKEIEDSQNLPKDERSVLWVVCELYDNELQKQLALSWDNRCPIIVTTDGSGKITSIQTFNVSPFNLLATDPAKAPAGESCRPACKFLKPRQGAVIISTSAAQTMPAQTSTQPATAPTTAPARPAAFFLLNDKQARVGSLSSGYFFEKIESPEQAEELTRIVLAGSTLVKTAQQYSDISDALAKSLPTSAARTTAQVSETAILVNPEPGLGFRVSALTIDNLDSPGLPQIVLRRINVSNFGQIGEIRELLCSPKADASAADIEAFRQAVRSALTAGGSELIPPIQAVPQAQRN